MGRVWEIIYSYPADTFVATFIGSPEMNLYRGRLLHKDGRPHFQGAGFSLDLEGLQLNLQEGEVGIRPEDIGISQGGAKAIQARVEMISNVGSEKYIHASLGQESLTIRSPKEAAIQPGQIIHLSIDPEMVHIFYEGSRIWRA